MRTLLFVLVAVWSCAALSVTALPRVAGRPTGRRSWTPQRPRSETLDRLVAHRQTSTNAWQRAWLQRKIYEHILQDAHHGMALPEGVSFEVRS